MRRNVHSRRASAAGGSKPSLRGGLVVDASLGDAVAGGEAVLRILVRDSLCGHDLHGAESVACMCLCRGTDLVSLRFWTSSSSRLILITGTEAGKLSPSRSRLSSVATSLGAEFRGGGDQFQSVEGECEG